MATVETSQVLETELTADVVAFCPFEGLEHLLVCGCYQLLSEEEPPRRIGRLTLLDATPSQPLRELQRFDGPGVLDCQWLPGDPSRNRILATASAEGGTHIYHLEAAADGGDAQPVLHDDGLVSCDGAGWCMGLDSTAPTIGPPQIALGSTAGLVHVCTVAPDGVRVERAWQAHELECWAVGWATHPEEPMKLYTGADDATLKAWDLRCDPGDVRRLISLAPARRVLTAHGLWNAHRSPDPRARVSVKPPLSMESFTALYAL